MANICDTEYYVTGNRNAVKGLWNTLHQMGVEGIDIPYKNLAEKYGIDWRAEDICVRGQINWAELEEDENFCYLHLDCEDDWGACTDFFNRLNKELGNELSISYREIECGCEVYHTHDEGNFFPEECYVDSYGGSFDDFEHLHDKVENVIKFWENEMGIQAEGKTEEEKMQFINEYDYSQSNKAGKDVLFQIHKFYFD